MHAIRPTLLVITLVTLGCGSDQPAESTKSAVKTCADLAKCCDKQSEPMKSACTAAANGKLEDACAASYDKMCAASDAGADATPDSGEDTAPVDPIAKARCEGYCSKSCGDSVAFEDCVSGCITASAKDAKCSREFATLVDCYAKAPSFTCKDKELQVEGCDPYKYWDCLSAP